MAQTALVAKVSAERSAKVLQMNEAKVVGARRMLTLLDGTRDREAMCAAMGCTREVMDAELWTLGRHGLLTG